MLGSTRRNAISSPHHCRCRPSNTYACNQESDPRREPAVGVRCSLTKYRSQLSTAPAWGRAAQCAPATVTQSSPTRRPTSQTRTSGHKAHLIHTRAYASTRVDWRLSQEPVPCCKGVSALLPFSLFSASTRPDNFTRLAPGARGALERVGARTCSLSRCGVKGGRTDQHLEARRPGRD